MATARKAPLKSVKKPATAYQFKIELIDVQPEVWRRVIVPGSAKLVTLHAVILNSMGWEGGHMHEFFIGPDQYGTLEREFGDDRDILDDQKITIDRAVRGFKSFTYVYDYGDNWEHMIKVEKALIPEPGLKLPVCLAGENACPPENSGGPYGYEDFLEAINDPKHEDHAELLAWCGGRFDPTAFDLAGVNEILSQYKL
jgi:hypothetical protein